MKQSDWSKHGTSNIIYEFIIIIVQPMLLNDTGGLIAANGTGGTYMLNCSADGIPRPKIFWRKNNQLILNSTRFQIVEREDLGENRSIRIDIIPEILQSTSMLIVHNVREIDTALYSCRGDNSAGLPALLQVPYNLTVAFCKYTYIRHFYIQKFINFSKAINFSQFSSTNSILPKPT